MLLTGETRKRRKTMAQLFIVSTRVTESRSESWSAAGPALQQLAALERAKDSLQETCRRLSTAMDCAAKLYAKIEAGTDVFAAAWDDAHPTQSLVEEPISLSMG